MYSELEIEKVENPLCFECFKFNIEVVLVVAQL